MNQDSKSKELQLEIEGVMQNLHNESYSEWVKNFAINLPEIWNENSAHELIPKDKNFHLDSNYAIVIGRGPSLKLHNHLEILAKSKFSGSIVCTDGALESVLKSGITPDKFPKFYVVTIDPYKYAKIFYDNPTVKKFGSKIKGIFSTIVNPEVVSSARDSGMEIHWVHSLFDYNLGEKSFNHISATMVRAKRHTNGLPGIQTGGNAGTSAWFVSWRILKCSNVVLIGIDHGWDENDSKEKILSHGRSEDYLKNKGKLEIDMSKEKIDNLLQKIHNPEFDSTCIVDPLFQFYRSALLEFISRSPSWLTTINATEGGSIFGEKITCLKFTDCLEKMS